MIGAHRWTLYEPIFKLKGYFRVFFKIIYKLDRDGMDN